jgi:hypothetical protein
VENLQWATQREQVQYSYSSNTTRKSNALKLSKPVKGRKIGTDAWVEYPSIKEAGRSLELSPGSISKCCIGTYKTTGEYEFKWGKANEVAELEDEVWKKYQSIEVSNKGR